VEQDDVQRGRWLLAEGLTLAHELSRWELARSLEVAVEVLGADGEWEHALHVAGTAVAMRDAMGTPAWPSEHARLDPVVARAREILGVETADAAWMRGWAAPADLTLTLALDRLRAASTDAESPPLARSVNPRWRLPGWSLPNPRTFRMWSCKPGAIAI
jgi:hypothetical protein